MTRKLREHTYVPDASLPPARRGDPPPCRCGLPRRHERHSEPAYDPEQAAYDARRLGEH